MWTRGLIGLAMIAVGVLWIAQGTGTVRGSMMSGHSQYAVLGVGVILGGLVLVVRAWRLRGRGPRP